MRQQLERPHARSMPEVLAACALFESLGITRVFYLGLEHVMSVERRSSTSLDTQYYRDMGSMLFKIILYRMYSFIEIAIQ